MKKIIIAAVLGALVFVAAPYACGQFLQHKNQAFIADFNTKYPFYNIDTVQEKVGIWQSEYAYEFKFLTPASTANNAAAPSAADEAKPNEAKPDEGLVVYTVPAYTVHHGPIPFTAIGSDAPFLPALATFALNYELADFLNTMQLASAAGERMASSEGEAAPSMQPLDPALLEQLPTLYAKGHASFLGKLHATMGWPAGELQHEGTNASWSAAEFSQVGSFDMSEADLEGNWAKLDITSPDGQMRLKDLSINGDSEINANFPSLPIMDVELRTAKLEFNSAATDGLIEIDNLGYVVRTDYANELLDMQVNYAADQLNGPTFNFDELDFDIELQQIDPAAAQQLYQSYMETVVTLMQESNTGVAAEANPNQFDNLLPELINLLAKHPKLAMSLKVDGQVEDAAHQLDAQLNANVDAVTEDQLSVISSMQMLPFIAPLAEAKLALTMSPATLQVFAKQMASGQVAQMVAAAEANGEAPPSAEQQAEMIDMISQQSIGQFTQLGFLLQEGEQYKTELDYNGGQLLINGNPAPF